MRVLDLLSDMHQAKEVQRLNKRAMFYALLQDFSSQQELDDCVFEASQLVGNVPRCYLGIQASSKGMMAGLILHLLSSSDLVSEDQCSPDLLLEHVPIPSSSDR